MERLLYFLISLLVISPFIFLVMISPAHGQSATVVANEARTTICEADGPCSIATDSEGRLLGVSAEDSAYSSGDDVFLMGSVRDDALADGGHGGTDGDKQPILTDSYGKLYTNTYQQGAIIMDGTTALTPKFAIIDDAASGNNEVVNQVAGKKIRVLSYAFICAGAVTVTWESGTDDAEALSGGMSVAANAGVSASYSPVGHFETSANEDLTLSLGGAVSCDGHVVYVEVS